MHRHEEQAVEVPCPMMQEEVLSAPVIIEQPRNRQDEGEQIVDVRGPQQQGGQPMQPGECTGRPCEAECMERPACEDRATSSPEASPPADCQQPARRRRRTGKQAETVAATAGRLRRSLSPAPCREPALRRRRLTGKQSERRCASPAPCEVPPGEGSWGELGPRRTATACPDPRGIGAGSRESAHSARTPLAATGANGGRPEAPLLGPGAPRLPASSASRPSSLARRTSHEVSPEQASP